MKKSFKIIGIILGVIIILGIIFFIVDYNRVQKQEKPIFCIKNPAGVIRDGGTVEYFGLGYKVIDFHTLAGFEDIKIGNWFMKYEDFSSEIGKYKMKFEQDNKKNYSKTIDGITIELNIPNGWNYEEVEESKNDDFKFALNFYKNSKEKNATLYFYSNMFGVCGTGLTNEKITLNNGKEADVGYYDGNKDWSFISFYELNRNIAFINNGLDSSEAKELLYFAKTINIDNEQSKEEYYFYGKVIESNATSIIVEPNENEEIRKSADKISIGLGQYNDELYMIGTNVKIIYDGNIMESYPAQVKATKIEVKSAENFEILFYDKHPMESYKIYTILDKSETDKYDYTIYGYDGSVNIRIDGKDYSLKEALSENKITMEEIIAKANQDEKDGKIKADMYRDGGSMEYHYENYTIIKCHTLDGNRDVYIGTKDLKLNDVI